MNTDLGEDDQVDGRRFKPKERILGTGSHDQSAIHQNGKTIGKAKEVHAPGHLPCGTPGGELDRHVWQKYNRLGPNVDKRVRCRCGSDLLPRIFVGIRCIRRMLPLGAIGKITTVFNQKCYGNNRTNHSNVAGSNGHGPEWKQLAQAGIYPRDQGSIPPQGLHEPLG